MGPQIARTKQEQLDVTRKYMAGWRARNRERLRQEQRARRRIVRQFLWDYKEDHPCIHCGESDPRCLTFHHRDPRDKAFQINVATRYWRLESIIAEVEKCDVICANCHLKLHDGRTDGRIFKARTERWFPLIQT